MKRFPLGDGRELVHFPLTGQTSILPGYVVSLLSTCRDIRPIEEHLQSLAGRLGLHSALPAAIRSLCEGQQSDHFTAESDFLAAAGGDDRSQPSRSRIGAVGIVTADRPTSMERCLAAFADNHERWSREVTFTIVDDSADGEVRRCRRTALTAAAGRRRVSVAYAGAEEKHSFVQQLAKTGIEPAVASFALLDVTGSGCSIGANRNALLLHHTGDLVLQVDDDITCRIAAPAGPRKDLCFTTGHNPNDFRFFPDYEGALAGANLVDCDVLAQHESLIGLGIRQCVSSHDGVTTSERHQLSDNMLRLAACGTGRVAVTQNGLLGDCGFGGRAPYLFFRGALREYLHESEHTYRTAITSRVISQGVQTATISEGSFCMAYALGLDNRFLLPPFFPVRRNEDGAFGVLLRACFDDALFGHVPIQLLHQPPEQRAYAADVWQASSPEVSTIVSGLVRSFDYGPVRDGGRRLMMIGRHLVDVGSAHPVDFLRFVRERAWTSVQSQVSALHALLKTYGRQPAYWARDCDRYSTALLQRAVEPDFAIPADLRANRGRDEALTLTKDLVRRFGELLVAWPDVVQAAQTLRSREIRLARDLAVLPKR